MSYVVFARKWRPQNFDELVGQEHVATTLKNAIKLNRISQAYLFAGPRGVGKTSTARILAKSLNCKEGPTPHPCNKCVNCKETTRANSLDVIEIDGASNRGIDEIRSLRENVKLSPLSGRFKIYVIDEVHQITKPAFDALLKTLEEPPPHVKFIFATTEPHKIPATILSRCQRFDFKRIPSKEIVRKLKEISKAEKIDTQESVFFEIARASDGSMRDAESILEQVNSFCEKKIEINDVAKVLGIIEEEFLLTLTEHISKKDITSALKMIDALTNEGKDLFQFLVRFIEHIRNLSVLKINKNISSALVLPDDTVNKLTTQSENFSLEDLIYAFYLLSSTYDTSRRTGLVRFGLEFALIKIVRREDIVPIDELLAKVRKLEKEVPSIQIAYSKEDRAPGEKKSTHQSAQQPEDNPVTPQQEVGSLKSLSDIWPTVIKVLAAKKPSLASFLMEGEPTDFKPGIIKIDFPKAYQLHKEILEKPVNQKMVEEMLTDLLNKQVKIEFHLVENLHRKNNFIFETEPDDKKEDDPTVKDALDVFKGSIVSKNKNFESQNG